MKLKFAFLFLLSVAVFSLSHAQDRYNTDKNHLAIEGYDPVSYLASSKAEKGSPAFTVTYEGAVFQFASAAHRDLFQGNPAKYLPQFGGWCAYAVAANSTKVTIDPKTFKVIDGKVYLFYNSFGTNTLNLWNKDEARLLPASHQHWAVIKNKPAK